MIHFRIRTIALIQRSKVPSRVPAMYLYVFPLLLKDYPFRTKGQ